MRETWQVCKTDLKYTNCNGARAGDGRRTGVFRSVWKLRSQVTEVAFIGYNDRAVVDGYVAIHHNRVLTVYSVVVYM